jgi:uncharacterized protein (TIGR03437 family)
MTARAPRLAAGCAAVLAFAAAQDGEAPPAIAQWGITNFASHMPPELPAGSIAQGSLIRIRGWRLGPAPLDRLAVHIRRGDTRVDATVLTSTENEVEALAPQNAPLGGAMLQVVRSGSASLEWPVTIVESSFGAFTRNGLGWGPGEITNSGGAPNSAAHPARPGEIVTLAGTGLGARPAPHLPEVLVAGRIAKSTRLDPHTDAQPGVNGIEFRLPRDTPEGCNVPVQVSSAPGIYSNAVTMAVSRNGGPCADQDGWTAAESPRQLRVGTVALLDADLALDVTSTQAANYPVDAGFASFAEIDPGASATPLFLFPPAGTCAAYTGTAGLHSITSPLAALEALPGKPLDAGPLIAVEGPDGRRLLPFGDARRRNYTAVIGGHAPTPGARDLPLFLIPGDYQVSAEGGPDIGPFRITVPVAPPLVWRSREMLAAIDRTRGATVSWHSTLGGRAIVLIVAMNENARSGALGVCLCVANAADERFRIPRYALANIPPSPAHPRGFPLNLVLLVELPRTPASAATAGLDQILGFAASVSGRTVRFE